MKDETITQSVETDAKVKKKKPTPKPTRVSMCYIGPTIPHVLQQNTVICGEQEKVEAQFNSIVEKYPQFNKLVCPVSELAMTKAKLNTGHNSISNAYGEMLNSIMKEEK